MGGQGQLVRVLLREDGLDQILLSGEELCEIGSTIHNSDNLHLGGCNAIKHNLLFDN